MKETRPNLADSYGIQPAADGTGLIPWSETTDRLATSRNYWFASADREGNPHSTPIWAVWLEDRLFFGTDPNSKKAHNIGANPRTVVHLESGDDVVILHCLVETERSRNRDESHRGLPIQIRLADQFQLLACPHRPTLCRICMGGSQLSRNRHQVHRVAKRFPPGRYQTALAPAAASG